MDDFLIARFNQLSVMKGRTNEYSTEGACHSFSIHWSLLMYQDGFPDRVHAANRMAVLAEGKGGSNPLLQKVLMDAFKEPDRNFRSNDDLLIALRGLVRAKYVWGGGRIHFDGAEQVRKIVAAPEFEAMVYSFEFPGQAEGATSGTHSIGFFRKLGYAKRGGMTPDFNEVSVFDPNYGEFLVHIVNFDIWLTNLFKYYSDNITYHRLFYVKENK